MPRLLFLLLTPMIAGLAQTVPFSTVEIAKKAGPAVVLIKGTGDGRDTVGSGFIVSPDGKIATSLHVIQGLKSAGVQLANGDVFDSLLVLGFDERRDLAVVQVPAFDLPIVELGNSNEVQPGESVVLIGSPRALKGSVSTGVVSGIRDLPEGFKIIQTDAAANPGSSGGPLLNSQGQVVGVLGFKLKGSENLNFAVPVNYLRGMLNALGSGMTLHEMNAKLGKAPDVFATSHPPPPARWKSLASGTTKLLRFDSDYIYVETLLPEELRRRGDFVISELRKQGDKHVGTNRSRLTCSYVNWLNEEVFNQCTEESPVEFTSVTSSRIEGRFMYYPEGTKVDCKRCTHSKKPIWRSFVWIPE